MFKIKKILQLKKNIKKIVLDEQQKKEVKENLISFMNTHPVRISETSRHKVQNNKNIFILLTQKHMFATLAIILTLLAGTGTAFAAENTLPGDTLYPVKIHVNESVRSALAVSAEAQDEWDTQVAERRLDEASKLAAKGELSAEKEEALSNRILEQTNKVQKHIEELKARGNVEAAANITSHLESILTIHQEILDALENDSTSTPKDLIRPLIKQLHEERDEIHEIRKSIEKTVEEDKSNEQKTSAENRMNASQNHIDEVSKFFAQKNISSTSTAAIKLEEAKKIQASGKISLEAGDSSKAFELFGQAQRMAQEAKLSAKIREEIKFNTRVEEVLQKVEERKIRLIEKQNKLEDEIANKNQEKNEDIEETENESIDTDTPPTTNTPKTLREKIKENVDEKIENLSEKQKQIEEKAKERAEKIQEELKNKLEKIQEAEKKQNER